MREANFVKYFESSEDEDEEGEDEEDEKEQKQGVDKS